MDLKYVLKLFIAIFLIMAFLIFIQSMGENLNDPPQTKKLLEVVTIEGLAKPDTSIIVDKSVAFCETHRGSSGTLDESCRKLTKNNCNSTSCCVFTSDDKCLAGGAQGPTFNSDSNGKTKALDYYYFQGKCHGNNCPKVA